MLLLFFAFSHESCIIKGYKKSIRFPDNRKQMPRYDEMPASNYPKIHFKIALEWMPIILQTGHRFYVVVTGKEPSHHFQLPSGNRIAPMP